MTGLLVAIEAGIGPVALASAKVNSRIYELPILWVTDFGLLILVKYWKRNAGFY